MLELKLEQVTMFEWQRHIQDSKDVLYYTALLDFIDLRAQGSKILLASWTASVEHPWPKRSVTPHTIVCS